MYIPVRFMEYRAADVRLRDTRLGRPGPGMTVEVLCLRWIAEADVVVVRERMDRAAERRDVECILPFI